MPNRIFSERLNAELDEIGMPQPTKERIETFSKLTELPRFKAQAVLNGSEIPNEKVLSFLANQLEVSVAWLLGKEGEPKH